MPMTNKPGVGTAYVKTNRKGVRVGLPKESGLTIGAYGQTLFYPDGVRWAATKNSYGNVNIFNSDDEVIATIGMFDYIELAANNDEKGEND